MTQITEEKRRALLKEAKALVPEIRQHIMDNRNSLECDCYEIDGNGTGGFDASNYIIFDKEIETGCWHLAFTLNVGKYGYEIEEEEFEFWYQYDTKEEYYDVDFTLDDASEIFDELNATFNYICDYLEEGSREAARFQKYGYDYD